MEAAPDATSVVNRVTFRATAQEPAAVALEEAEAAGRDVSSAAKTVTFRGTVPREETGVKRRFLCRPKVKPCFYHISEFEAFLELLKSISEPSLSSRYKCVKYA